MARPTVFYTAWRRDVQDGPPAELTFQRRTFSIPCEVMLRCCSWLVDEMIRNTEFQENGHLIVKKFLDPRLCDFLSQYFWLLKINGLITRDAQVPDSDVLYGDCAFETLMASSQGPLCDLLRVKLFPTYSYGRMYFTGNELKPHLDRPSCEVSVTVCLGGESEKSWPIYIEKAAGEGMACHLGIGDALVFKGCERKHWREPFEGVWQAQVFMHYVDADGPYAEWKFDKRPFLGAGLRNTTRASTQE